MGFDKGYVSFQIRLTYLGTVPRTLPPTQPPSHKKGERELRRKSRVLGERLGYANVDLNQARDTSICFLRSTTRIVFLPAITFEPESGPLPR